MLCRSFWLKLRRGFVIHFGLQFRCDAVVHAHFVSNSNIGRSRVPLLGLQCSKTRPCVDHACAGPCGNKKWAGFRKQKHGYWLVSVSGRMLRRMTTFGHVQAKVAWHQGTRNNVEARRRHERWDKSKIGSQDREHKGPIQKELVWRNLKEVNQPSRSQLARWDVGRE